MSKWLLLAIVVALGDGAVAGALLIVCGLVLGFLLSLAFNLIGAFVILLICDPGEIENTYSPPGG